MKAVIFDIDGTLANGEHRERHLTGEKKDWDSYYAGMGEDTPHAAMVALLGACRKEGWQIVLCTGRPETYVNLTMEWLERHGVTFARLYMRPDGDFRPDYVIKKEFLDQMRTQGMEIVFVVEDRAQVVEMWREEGLLCLQCAPGDF